MYKKKIDFSAVILAAGNSTRMGVPKFSLTYSAKYTFLEQIINIFNKAGCKEIIVVLNNKGAEQIKENTYSFPENVKITINKHPEWDRFYSVKTGLKSLSLTHPIFIANVDNPFVTIEIINALLHVKDKAEYIHPEYKGTGGHPILLSESIVNNIINEKENKLHFREYLNNFTKHVVIVEDEKVIANINTPEEYNYYF